ICIDTQFLIRSFLKEGSGTSLKRYKDNDNERQLWSKIFKLDTKSFRKGPKYRFNFMIKTDGVSCSILFIRVGEDGRPLEKTTKNKKLIEILNTEYIEKTKITGELKQMKVVCADPGKSDLIYCGSENP